MPAAGPLAQACSEALVALQDLARELDITTDTFRKFFDRNRRNA